MQNCALSHIMVQNPSKWLHEPSWPASEHVLRNRTASSSLAGWVYHEKLLYKSMYNNPIPPFYMYTYVCVYMYVYTYNLCIYICNLYMFIHMNIYIYIHIYVYITTAGWPQFMKKSNTFNLDFDCAFFFGAGSFGNLYFRFWPFRRDFWGFKIVINID